MKSVWGRLGVVGALTLFALYSVAPTAIYFNLPKETRNDSAEFEKAVPEFFSKEHVKLGLDLQGGVQLVLGVESESAIANKLSRIGTEAKRWSDDDQKVKIESAYVTKGTSELTIVLAEDQDEDDFKEAFKEQYDDLTRTGQDGRKLIYGYGEDQVKKIRESALEQAERVVRSRVDKWGVSEPVINRRADGSIIVQLPGFKNPEKAKELLGRTAQLRFKIVDDSFTGFDKFTEADLPEGVVLGNNGGQVALVAEKREMIEKFVAEKAKLPDDRELLFEKEELAGGTKLRWTTIVVNASTELSGEDVYDASVGQGGEMDPSPRVFLKFSDRGGKRFADVTGANVNKRMAILLDDVVESAPNIQEKISGGTASITLGSGRSYDEKYEEANELALILKSGAVPANIEVMEERQVGSSLGPELANQGVKGILVGLLMVLVFMVIWYRKPGMLACVALVLNGVFLLALMAGFGFALTLPGIAGFILTLGMAVDANVLINERIRQELREGKNAKKAVENGFGKVFWTIIDANVTTLIAAVVLLQTNSSGPVRGFALTLMLGLFVSMFTSLYCSRLFFDLALRNKTSDGDVRTWLGGKAAQEGRNFHFNFLNVGKLATFAFVGAAVVVLGTGGVRGLNWGVDFAGGTEVLLKFDKDVESSQITGVGKSVGLTPTVQNLEGGKTQFIVRFEGEKADSKKDLVSFQNFKTALNRDLASFGPEIQQVDYVGPQIGRELRQQGFISVFYAMLGVILYIFLRFDSRFAPGALVKMGLDVAVMMGFYVFAWRTFDLTSVAAFLTVVGYSVNDTIVIYDRIRENLLAHGRRDLFDNINFSLNETLSRTINTSITTVVALMGILIFGSGQIWNFAMAMTIGVILATFSSTFVASSFILWWDKFQSNRATKKVGGKTPATASQS